MFFIFNMPSNICLRKSYLRRFLPVAALSTFSLTTTELSIQRLVYKFNQSDSFKTTIVQITYTYAYSLCMCIYGLRIVNCTKYVCIGTREESVWTKISLHLVEKQPSLRIDRFSIVGTIIWLKNCVCSLSESIVKK